MTHLSGFERAPIFWLPEAVDDDVGADNPVRFIDAFAGARDLAAAGFVRAAATATGRPGYAPADLLKLSISGSLNRVRSSRRLKMESRRNSEVIWLRRSLKPDFKTIADFRCDHRGAFWSVLRAFALLCWQLDLFVWSRVAGRGRNSAQGGQQQGLYPERAAKFHSRRR
jgi:transposase